MKNISKTQSNFITLCLSIVIFSFLGCSSDDGSASGQSVHTYDRNAVVFRYNDYEIVWIRKSLEVGQGSKISEVNKSDKLIKVRYKDKVISELRHELPDSKYNPQIAALGDKSGVVILHYEMQSKDDQSQDTSNLAAARLKVDIVNKEEVTEVASMDFKLIERDPDNGNILLKIPYVMINNDSGFLVFQNIYTAGEGRDTLRLIDSSLLYEHPSVVDKEKKRCQKRTP